MYAVCIRHTEVFSTTRLLESVNNYVQRWNKEELVILSSYPYKISSGHSSDYRDLVSYMLYGSLSHSLSMT